MDAKLMVATDPGDVKNLKDVLNKEDVTMVVVRATSKKPSEGDQPLAGNINPLLLMSARMGSWEALNVLLEMEDAKKPPMIIPTPEFLELLASVSSSQSQGGVAARDVEEGFDHQPALLAAGALLKGVTLDGDTALHAVASNGDSRDFLKYAGIINKRDKGLLFAKNHKGDTPLHCAARDGNSKMVSHLIDLAAREGADTKLEFLRMQNKRHETALHEAVRFEYGRRLRYQEKALIGAPDPAREEKNKCDEIGGVLNEDGKSPGAADGTREEMDIVKLLMGADAELANYPADGVSPLYLAILLHKSTIALTLYDMSGGNLSYSGANGQNALHVAVLRDRVMVEFLVHWNRSLTTQVDNDGSTPLHFASLLYIGSDLRFKLLDTAPWCRFEWIPSGSKTLNVVFNANPAALYQPDKEGYFPIHVAAFSGVKGAIQFFHNEYPDSAGLCDAKGRTFLHVAVNMEKLHIVSYVCRTPSLAWILNMQDNDGNTALHLAIKARSFKMFCSLFGSPCVDLGLINNQGETLRHLSISMVPHGISYRENPEYKINEVLGRIGVSVGALRWDKLNERFRGAVNPRDEDKESHMLGNSAQIAAVLIATVAFTATFALPGGYRADDHINGGTPTRAGSYAFDAFMMATTLAFICSIVATVGFVSAGIPMVNLKTRRVNSAVAVLLMSSSLTSMSIAFALGVYMVLAPVARSTAVAVCAITPAMLLSVNRDSIFQCVILARPICTRIGLLPGTKVLIRMHMQIVVFALWPIIVTFGWAALARIHRNS